MICFLRTVLKQKIVLLHFNQSLPLLLQDLAAPPAAMRIMLNSTRCRFRESSGALPVISARQVELYHQGLLWALTLRAHAGRPVCIGRSEKRPIAALASIPPVLTFQENLTYPFLSLPTAIRSHVTAGSQDNQYFPRSFAAARLIAGIISPCENRRNGTF